MDVILVCILVVLCYVLWTRKEGFESYDEDTCMSLAQKNAANIDDLKKQVDAVLALKTKFDSLQSTTDANSKQLKSIVDQVYKTS